MPGVAVFGVSGRMGQSLVRLLAGTGDEVGAAGLTLSGAIGARGGAGGADAATSAGIPATGVLVTDDPAGGLRGAAVAVDFSRPECVADHAQACVLARVPLLVGTTGLDGAARAALQRASRQVAVLIAPNTSLGVVLMMRLVREAAAVLSADFDVEIAETHHRHKRDAPSGTALALGDVVAAARGAALDDLAVFDRHGTSSPRSPGSIGFSAQRAGDVVGEHTVLFATAGERLEITHRAADRAIFARGALRAAAWLVGRPAGLYGMESVLDPPRP